VDDDAESAAAPPGGASHAARGSLTRPRTVALVAGGLAVLAGVGIGVVALLDTAPRPASTGMTADRITVSRAPVDFPVAHSELLALLNRPADLGPLTDPVRRAGCLSALGFPGSASVLGADSVDVGGRPVILLVLAGDGGATLTGLAVAPTCGAADPGLLAETVVARAPTPR
jgi:hypothetical protein